jgi:hypothetical protein
MTASELVVLAIGDTGTGKSSFGNLYLKDSKFLESDSPTPVTKETSACYSDIDGMRRYVIDTQGLEDGETINEVHIQQMGEFLKNWKQGIHAIAILLNGQQPKFSQSAQDIIRFAYNIFETPDSLNNICLVFTRCFEAIPDSPNRDTLQTEYRQVIQNFLEGVSGARLNQEVPIFFVDTQDPNGSETESNMAKFQDWILSRTSFDASCFKNLELREETEEELQNRVFLRYDYSGDSRFAVYEDKTRTKFTPFNGDPPRYSDWTVVRQYQEPAGTKSQTTERVERKYEIKEVCHHGSHSMFGFSSHNHTHYSVYHKVDIEERPVYIDYDGNRTYGGFYVVNSSRWYVYGGEEGGHSSPYTRPI